MRKTPTITAPTMLSSAHFATSSMERLEKVSQNRASAPEGSTHSPNVLQMPMLQGVAESLFRIRWHWPSPTVESTQDGSS
jgi:hypothetical protein